MTEMAERTDLLAEGLWPGAAQLLLCCHLGPGGNPAGILPRGQVRRRRQSIHQQRIPAAITQSQVEACPDFLAAKAPAIGEIG